MSYLAKIFQEKPAYSSQHIFCFDWSKTAVEELLKRTGIGSKLLPFCQKTRENRWKFRLRQMSSPHSTRSYQSAQSFQLQIKDQHFLSVPSWLQENSSGCNLGVGRGGGCTFSIKLYLAWWHFNTKNMHSNMLVEKLLRKIYILFFNMQVEFVLSVSGGINPSQGKLVTWYCLVKSKLSPEIHLESTNAINGWIKNQ